MEYRDMQGPTLIFVFALSYFYFWFHSFPESGIARVIAKDSWEREEEVRIKSFDWFSIGSTLWSGALVFAALQPPGACSLHPSEWRTLDTLLSVLAIMLSGKVFLMPAASTFKSYQREPDGRLTENLRMAAFDFATGYITSIGNVLVYKFSMIIFFSLLIWALGWETKSSPIPDGVFCAWAVYEFGRGLRLARKPDMPGAMQLIIFGANLLSMFVVWMLTERILTNCGVNFSNIPSLATFTFAVIALPLMEFLVMLSAFAIIMFSK